MASFRPCITSDRDSRMSVQDDLEPLYRRYRDKVQLSDRDWAMVNLAMDSFAEQACGVASQRYNVPFSTIEDLRDGVRVEMLAKFMQRKYEPDGPLTPYLRAVAMRQVLSNLRQIKSVGAATTSSVSEDDAQGIEMSPAREETPQADNMTLFVDLRASLGPWRFPEYPEAPDLLLVYLLQTGSLPPPSVLVRVPKPMQRTVFNVAAIAINAALMVMRDREAA
jgi:hypothetical protein